MGIGGTVSIGNKMLSGTGGAPATAPLFGKEIEMLKSTVGAENIGKI